MKRRLVTDYLTDQMLADAQPDGDGWVNYKAFVERQFAVKNLSIKMKPLEKDPSVAAVKQKLQTIYGDPAGPKYPYPYKTNQQLYAELGGKGDETRKYLAFGKEQLGVLKEAIGAEQQANVVEEKIKALAESTSVPETAILLREIEASHTGYKHVLDLQSVTLKVTGMLDDLSLKEQQQVEKLEQQRQRIIAKWTEYTG